MGPEIIGVIVEPLHREADAPEERHDDGEEAAQPRARDELPGEENRDCREGQQQPGDIGMVDPVDLADDGAQAPVLAPHLEHPDQDGIRSHQEDLERRGTPESGHACLLLGRPIQTSSKPGE